MSAMQQLGLGRSGRRDSATGAAAGPVWVVVAEPPEQKLNGSEPGRLGHAR
jgi:hypothetical protein